MTLVTETPSSDSAPVLGKEMPPHGLISIQSLVTCATDDDDLFDHFPPPAEESISGSSEDLSSIALLTQVVGKLERQNSSCESVGSILSEDDSNEEGNSSDDGGLNLKKDPNEVAGEGGGGGCERSTSVVSDASEDGARDSGFEAEADMPPMVVPDAGLMEKIVAQVEFYFSDANVVKDKFLLKHIRRNKEGYVSLKLVSSFKKVRQLTKDWRVVAFALGKVSALIQINDQRTKIRRTSSLPEIDDSPVTCAVLALDLPLEKPSVESVSKLFGAMGDIAFVRVLRAGGSLPPDVKSLLTKYPVLGVKHCAWIEFESPEAAKEATELSQDEGMKVVLIVPESQKKQEKMNQQKLSHGALPGGPGSRKGSLNKTVNKSSSSSRKSSYNSFNNNSSNNYILNNNNNSNYNTNPYNNSFYPKQRKDSGFEHDVRRPALQQRRKAVSLPSAQNPFLNGGDPNRRCTDPRRVRPKSKSVTEFYSSSGSPPHSWVQRHLLAAAAASAASAASPVIGSRPPSTRISRVSVGSLPLSEGIVRFPKGPDGSKGFGKDSRLRQIIEAS